MWNQKIIEKDSIQCQFLMGGLANLQAERVIDIVVNSTGVTI
jgi:hypothetical protein